LRTTLMTEDPDVREAQRIKKWGDQLTRLNYLGFNKIVFAIFGITFLLVLLGNHPLPLTYDCHIVSEIPRWIKMLSSPALPREISNCIYPHFLFGTLLSSAFVLVTHFFYKTEDDAKALAKRIRDAKTQLKKRAK